MLRFVGGDNPTHLKIFMTVHGENMVATVKLSDSVSDLKSLPLYSD